MAENELRKRWFIKRVQQIHQMVSAYDILRHNNVDLNQAGDETEEQISCPFHGEDRKPSARVYPSGGGDDHSHVWCFVCQQPHWDAIGLWRMFNGGPDNCGFSQALTGIERAFGLSTPEAPTGVFEDGPEKPLEDQAALSEFKARYVQAESRLLSCRAAYQYLQDMRGYLAAGSALDKIRARVGTQKWKPEKGTSALVSLLDKIGEKVRRCPVG